jgi:hypothetical protein
MFGLGKKKETVKPPEPPPRVLRDLDLTNEEWEMANEIELAAQAGFNRQNTRGVVVVLAKEIARLSSRIEAREGLASAGGGAIEWTDKPEATGAYWMQYQDARPDICWVHDGRVWFAPESSLDYSQVAEYAELGCRFYGPLPAPPSDER